MKFLLFLRGLLDPDTNWRSFSTIQHFIAGFLYMAIFDHYKSQWESFWWTTYSAVLYEVAQTDIAYSIKDGSGKRYAGRPGYGFGLMDIGATWLGAGLYVLLRALVF